MNYAGFWQRFLALLVDLILLGLVGGVALGLIAALLTSDKNILGAGTLLPPFPHQIRPSLSISRNFSSDTRQ